MLDNTSTPTFVLPRLPVPNLHNTLTKYLASLEPFLLEDSDKASHASKKRQRAKWASEFEHGIGKTLQARLIALDKTSPHNWLDDNFWINAAYLEWRAPLLVNSNYWVAFEDDPQSGDLGSGPSTLGSGGRNFASNNRKRSGTTGWQIKRAAWLVHRMMHVRDRIESGELYPPTTPKGVWIRQNVSKMFNFARIPQKPRDALSALDPSSPYHSCVFVMLCNWCYAVRVYHDHEIISTRELEARLHAVVRDVDARLGMGEQAFPVGVLSADGRDQWAENLEYLCELSPVNQHSHQAMLHSIMGLSLDSIFLDLLSASASFASPTSNSPCSSTVPSQTHLAPACTSTATAHLHATRSQSTNVSNRFFDKPFTFIVDPEGRAGGMGEHSACDGLVPSMMAELTLEEGVDVGYEKEKEWEEKEGVVSEDGECWERLDWITDSRMEQECLAAEDRACSLIADSDCDVLPFKEYGTTWVTANFSSDAYIQMALQLAWYKIHGGFTATYETVLTRMFQHGRTETVRTLTRESREWVLSMVDPKASSITRHFLLHHAIHTHTQLTREAAIGRGIDRHLMGLQLLLRSQDGEQPPALFADELFSRSTNWKLSTSALGRGKAFKGTGFGALCKDGYGINYLAGPDMIKFGIESKYSCEATSTSALCEAIVQSLQEMQDVCLALQKRDISSTVYRVYLYLYTRALHVRETIAYLLF